MTWFQNFLFTIICTSQLVFPSSGLLECKHSSSNSHQISLLVNSTRSNEGEWRTFFLADQNSSHNPRNIDLNITRSFVTCQGNHYIQIGGFLNDMPQKQIYAKLTFKRNSKNAVIINNGLSLQKVKLDINVGSGITNRPLLEDEIFTVRIDEKAGASTLAVGIGLTTLTFDGEDLKDNSYDYKYGTWMFYDRSLIQNGSVVYRNYLKKDLKEVQVGQTVGVMRSRLGVLHLFVNGVDQGPAASNIPDNVYGVFDLYGSVSKATIVEV